MLSIFALPLKCGSGKRPPLIASASGSVDQMKCFTPASFAARTALAACRRSSVPGCQKLVTRKTPCAPSRAARIASGRSRFASTTSSASARCFAGSRVRARTLNTPRSCRARTTAPPCCPVAPKTAMVLRVFDDMISPSVQWSSALQRESPGAAGDHVQQAAEHGEVLREEEHLHECLVRRDRPERVEDRRDCDREEREEQGGEARAVA